MVEVHPPIFKTRQNWGKIANYPPPPMLNKDRHLWLQITFYSISVQKTVSEELKTWYFPYSAFWLTGQLEGLQHTPPPPSPHWLRYWFHASILLLHAVELVRLWCINFISVKLFESYYGPLVRCVDTCWCYLKGYINYNYYFITIAVQFKGSNSTKLLKHRLGY